MSDARNQKERQVWGQVGAARCRRDDCQWLGFEPSMLAGGNGNQAMTAVEDDEGRMSGCDLSGGRWYCSRRSRARSRACMPPFRRGAELGLFSGGGGMSSTISRGLAAKPALSVVALAAWTAIRCPGIRAWFRGPMAVGEGWAPRRQQGFPTRTGRMARLLPFLVVPVLAARAAAQEPPVCTQARVGRVICMAGRMCTCKFERGGTLAGRRDGHRWDCGALRPDCGPVAPPELAVPNLVTPDAVQVFPQVMPPFRDAPPRRRQ